MRKLLLALLVLLTLHTSVGAQFKDPHAQVREAKNFHAIRIESAFDVYLSQGNEEAVAVSASEEKILDKIIVEVEGGVLIIRFDSRFRLDLNNKKLKAYISFKTIDKLDVSGACTVKIEGIIKTNDLHIMLSGASDLKGKLEVVNLKITQSGAADINVSGVATNLDLTVSGVCRFKGYDLVTDYCIAQASGNSDLRITVNKELAVHASGNSDIDYKGSGIIKDIQTSGNSSIKKAG